MNFTIVEPASRSIGWDPACSEAATSLRGMFVELQESFGLRGELAVALSDLSGAARDANEPGWDGGDALPMPAAAFERARRLLLALPSEFSIPEIEADPRGGVLMTWSPTRGARFSLALSGDDRVDYAGILGDLGFNGSDRLRGDGLLPRSLVDGLRRIIATRYGS